MELQNLFIGICISITFSFRFVRSFGFNGPILPKSLVIGAPLKPTRIVSEVLPLLTSLLHQLFFEVTIKRHFNFHLIIQKNHHHHQRRVYSVAPQMNFFRNRILMIIVTVSSYSCQPKIANKVQQSHHNHFRFT